MGFSRREAAIIAASRHLGGGDVVMVGQGLPVIVALFAKRRWSAGIVIMNEYGVVDAAPPFAVELAHPLLAETSTYLCDMIEALASLLWHADLAVLGAAQVDRYGNVNTTVVGDYLRPKVRISGSGGANDIGSIVRRFVIVMDRQSPSKFPEEVDYLTTPGYFKGSREERTRLGLPGDGPEAVVTDLGIYRFKDKTGEMYLDALQPGVTIDEVRANTGWDISIGSNVTVAESPGVEDVRLLRSLDERGIYLK